MAFVLPPALVALHGQRPNEPQVGRLVGDDPHHVLAPPDLLEALQRVGRLHVLVVRDRQSVGVAPLPFLQPHRDVGLGLLEFVEPAQLLQAVIVAFPRQVVDGIPQEVHIAALPGRPR